jgi:hypothetical protein
MAGPVGQTGGPISVSPWTYTGLDYQGKAIMHHGPVGTLSTARSRVPPCIGIRVASTTRSFWVTRTIRRM